MSVRSPAQHETDTGTAVQIYAGESLTLAETFAVPGNAANYNSTLACTGTECETDRMDGWCSPRSSWLRYAFERSVNAASSRSESFASLR